MKTKKISAIIILAILMVATGFYFTTTGFSGNRSVNAAKLVFADSTKADIYYCPMHTDVTSDKPGTCPKCGMDLIKKEDTDKDKSMNMMNGNMDKCKEMGCNMESCKGESGACKDCKDCKDGCKNMMKMDDKKMDKDCKMGNNKDCKSKCMGK